MKKVLGAAAAVGLALLLFSPPAEARCWWNGYRWHCSHYRYHHYARYYGYPYYSYYYPHYYRPYYYRPYYACVWPFCW